MSEAETSDTEQRVLRIVREVLPVTDRDIDLEASIARSLAPDSLEQLTLFLALEDEFGSTIPPEEAESLLTLRDVIRFIEERRGRPDP